MAMLVVSGLSAYAIRRYEPVSLGVVPEAEARAMGPRRVAFEGLGETVPGRYVVGLAIAVGSVRSRPS